MIEIRPMSARDIEWLTAIDPGFEIQDVLRIEKEGTRIEVGWRLREHRLSVPCDKGRSYDLLPSDLEGIRARLQEGCGIYLVAEEGGRPVAMLDAEVERWNNTLWLWNLLVDRAYRGRGIGKGLFDQAVGYARQQGVRAILIETQSNNVPACRFYVSQGCELVGLNDFYYSNQDLELGEVALFWAYRVDDAARGAE